jgi:hypothetical protein
MVRRREEDAIEVLAAHAETMAGKLGEPITLKGTEEYYLRPLMTAAERVKGAMLPVEPPGSFVQTLGQSLVEESRRRRVAAQRMRRGMVIGAAALGSALSIVGVLTYVLYKRRNIKSNAMSG